MKKKISVLALMLCCLLILAGCCSHEWLDATCEAPKTCTKCGETEGEAPGHIWADATCTAPKICSVCHAQEGSALGHDWIDATTEAPMTCAACAITEGERIITDPRFTTASTKDLYGKWHVQAPAGSSWLSDLDMDAYQELPALELQVDYEFFNDGTVHAVYTALNTDQFVAAFADMLAQMMYAQFAEVNLTTEQADEMMRETYDMSVSEFTLMLVQELDLPQLLENASFNGVYYVEGNRLFIAYGWDKEMSETQITVDGDSLIIETDFSGFFDGATTFHRVSG